MLSYVEQIVREAGEITKRDFLNSVITHYKKELGNFSTKTDVEIEDFLVERLKKLLPKSGFYLEERDNHQAQSEYEWIIDPIDGTHNFHLGFPNFSISVALKKEDDLFLGVVYNPVAGQMYSGEVKKGATVNGQKIKVSNRDSLAKTTLTYSQSWQEPRNGKLIGLVRDKINPKIGRMMTNWSVALDYCYLARGATDVLIDYKDELHDRTAGFIIAQEAGARITDFSGKPATYKTPDLLLSNGTKIHDCFVEKLKEIKK